MCHAYKLTSNSHRTHIKLTSNSHRTHFKLIIEMVNNGFRKNQVACGALRCTENFSRVFCVTGALSTNARRPRWRCASRWLRLARCIHRTVDSAPLATAARRRAAPRCNASPRALCKWRVLIGREERSSSERRERGPFGPNFRFLTFCKFSFQ